MSYPDEYFEVTYQLRGDSSDPPVCTLPVLDHRIPSGENEDVLDRYVGVISAVLIPCLMLNKFRNYQQEEL